ncbi:T9SS type B sorting domain-containing protein [Lentimicrobium saccharophilum]|nr:gliding motility-associated C-terminal domain-containing protein [Lentimicrobium saccharophilum]
MLTLLALTALSAAGQYEIDRVCVGAERHYRIDGEAGSTYSWLLTDPLGVITTLPEEVDTVTIIWNVPVGVYALTNLQFGANGCDTTQLGTITVFEQPGAFAGNSFTLCSPEPVLLDDATASDYSGLLWTTSGDGTFDDATLLNPTYTFGPNDIANGNVILTLTAQGLGYSEACTPAVSSLTITINNLQVTFDIVNISCHGGNDGSVTFTASGGTEPYTFTLNGNTNGTGLFENLTAGTYTYIITDDAGCETTGDVSLTEPELLTASATPLTATLCINESATFTGAHTGGTEPPAGHLWTGSGAVYLNDATLEAPEFNSPDPGTWSLFYTITDANGCEATAGEIIITVEPETIPAFDPIGPLCQNSTAPALPLTSVNGITGTWNPASISTLTAGTFTFTFTPDAGQCATTVTLEVTIDEEVTPAFAQIGPLCQNSVAPALPAASLEGITGTWNPATITTAAAGTFTFTFTPDDPAQCGIPVDMVILINEEITPAFAQIGPLCQNSTAPALPLISDNGITGSWNPATINTAVAGTFTFTFTPDDPAQCGIPVDMVILINEEITPAFAQIGPLCQNSTAPALPLISDNGITGSWNPATINTAVAGTFTFTFTPDNPAQCGIPVDMVILINEEITPAFAQIGPLCQNSVAPALPAASIEGITGSWNPATINTAVAGTFTFTFTPDNPAQCGVPTTMDIVITDEIVPTFAQIGPLCQNSAAPALPAASIESITGIWNPATINTAVAGTFTFTFTPDDPAQCGVPTTMDIVITNEIVPTFAQIGPLCQNSVAPALPATSIEGITGIWNPATITTTTAGSFTFTFTPDDPTQCGVPTTMDIVITDEIVPTFAQIGPLCQNSAAPALPAASIEGITGTWNPATISTAVAGTFTFTFTPDDPTQCGIPTTMDIVITDEIVPTFAQIGPLCQNSVAPALPVASIEGITGTWNPATISTAVAGTFTFTFTPNDPAQCGIPTTMDIVITDEIVPTFAQIGPLCQNSVAPALPAASIEGITGTWNPATISTAVAGTFTFTFTPNDPAQCGAPTTMDIVITDEIVPTFAQIGPLCQNSVAPALPAASIEGITGIWNPATINTAVVGTFTFTFTPDDPAQCGVPTTMDIVITDELIVSVTGTNPTTPGGNDGTATATVTGGTPPYTYLWDDPLAQTTQTATGLVAGLYNVLVTDANGCEGSGTITLTDPEAPLTAEVDFTNVTCFGGNDGSITISNPQNGSGNYEYSIDGGASWHSTSTFNGLIAGSYTVMLRDADVPANEVTLTTVVITEPAILAATVAWTNETFPGANDGSITISAPSGGSGAYEYSIDGINWQAGNVFNGLAPGFYDVYIRDANATDCYILLQTVEILPGNALTADVDFTNVTCFGGNDGSITISNPQNGSGNYEFSIDGGATWQSGNTFTGLIAGSYTVMMRDADVPANEVTLTTVVITEPAILAATAVWTNETYPGANDGSIAVSAPSGGSGAYEYSIDGTNWQASGNFTGLAPGTYDVYIRDANATDCYILLQTIEILPGNALTADVDFTNVTCFGGNDGSITISNPQNGSGNYEYSIDGGTTWQSGNAFTGLIAGSYTVMMRDADVPANEVTLTTVVITEPAILAATIIRTDETYPGANDGSITVSAPSGGSGAYEYSIDGTTWQASGNFTGLAPGNYDVYIRDANATDCYILLQTIEILPGNALAADVDFTNVTCFGGNDGSITISNPQNGSGNYEYSIDGGTTWHGTGAFTGLTAGTYEVMLRDADVPANEVTLTTVVITEPAILTATITWTNETYTGAIDGSITVSAPAGGSGTYEYSIDGINWQASGDFTALAPGSYNVYIRDANVTDCFILLQVIEILPADALTADIVFTNVTCFGGSDGSITISNPQNGTGNYEYSIDGGFSWQIDGNYTGLLPGSYVVMLRDADIPANTETLTTIIITEPAILAGNVTWTHESFPGANDGSITISTPTGGSGAYEYSIDGINWQAGNVFNGLAPGFYDVYIRDANATDCFIFLKTAEILPGGSLSAEVASTNVTCFGGNDGTISITNPQNGSGVYEYSIDGGVTWQNSGLYTGLTPGTYVVMLRDANAHENEVTLDTVIITEPAILTAIVTWTDETFPGGNNGTITVTMPSGGSGAYEYSIDGINWQASGNFTGLAPGNYDVYIRDANATDCYILLQTIQILPANALTANVSYTNISCNGLTDGTISITDPQNGSGTYEYSIDNGATWQGSGIYTGLPAGVYVVMMRDALEPVNSVILTTITITEPAILSATVTWTNETLPGANDGTITVSTPSGGSGAYEYSINGMVWQASGVFTGLVPGFYQVFIRDANAPDCYINLMMVEIQAAGALTADVTSTNVTCFGGNDGSITISNPTGGSGNYEYSIDNINWQTTNTFGGLTAGSYTVWMRDADDPANFVTLAVVAITQPAILAATVTWTNETLPGANDGTITVSAPSGGSGAYEYSIDGVNWQASGLFNGLAPGNYDVYIRDANATDCFILLQTVTILPAGSLSAQVDHTDVTCFGGNDGSITISNPTGGSGNYEYSIDNINWQTAGTFGGLTAGSYTVWMRDADDPANFVTLAVVAITQPAILAATVTWTNETLPGANDGTITVSTPSGGSGAYEYSIDGVNWQASGLFNGLAPGNYDVYIRDANATDCFILLQTVTILPAGSLSAQVDHTDVTCFGGNDGSITISNPTGGSGNYEYSIDNINWQTAGTYGGLTAGSYAVWMRDAGDPGLVINLGTFTIAQPELLTAIPEVVPASCAGVADGSITFTNPAGGSGNYQYSISNGLNWQNIATFGNLAAGNYQTWIRDASHLDCQVFIGEVTVTEPDAILATAETISTTCGEENGSITIAATGGSGALEYMLDGISGWQSTAVFADLAAGTYTVTVRDASGCTISLTNITVTAIPAPVIVSLEVENAVNGDPNGSVIIIANGTAPLQYSLDGINWQTGNSFTGLAIGPYMAWVMDADGCTVTQEFNILNTVLGEVLISTDTVTYCLNLPVVIPVDARDFNDISSFVLELEFDPSIISFNGLLNINGALSNGTFSTSIIGNVLQIRYSIFDGSATVGSGQQLFSLSFDALAAGNSNLEWNWLQCVIYSSGNDSIPGIYVNGMAEILPSPEIFALGEGDYCTGDSLTLRSGTGTGELLNYYWTGPNGTHQTGPAWQLGTLGTNDAGNYHVVATNSYFCNSEEEIQVNVYPSPEIHIGYADTICYGQPVLLDPGSGYISYLWHDGSTMQSMVAYEAGDYWVNVEDENGCRGADSVALVPCNIELRIPNAITPNGDGLNDVFRPIFIGWEPSRYSMHVYTKWGQLIYESYDPGEGWDGTVDGELVSPNSFVYVIAFEAPSYVTRLTSSPVTGSVTVIR